jgi:hypothetical protein
MRVTLAFVSPLSFRVGVRSVVVASVSTSSVSYILGFRQTSSARVPFPTFVAGRFLRLRTTLSQLPRGPSPGPPRPEEDPVTRNLSSGGRGWHGAAGLSSKSGFALRAR